MELAALFNAIFMIAVYCAFISIPVAFAFWMGSKMVRSVRRSTNRAFKN